MSIQISNLTHIYNIGQPDEQKALDSISLEIPDRCFAGLIGHTGSGKSTLLQHMNGLLKPTRGRVYVDGEDINSKNVVLADIRKKVGLVFQYPEYQLFEETVALDVAFGPKNLGLPEKQVDLRVREALELVGLDYEEVKDVSPFDLSGGQKRRAAIAGVIAMQPSVLILDEPTAGLDPGSRADILGMIKDLHEKRGSATVLVSHNMDDIAALADKVIVMDEGTVAMEGTPREVFARADELEKLGLGVPDVTRILARLKDRGLDVEPDTFDIRQAAIEIAGAAGIAACRAEARAEGPGKDTAAGGGETADAGRGESAVSGDDAEATKIFRNPAKKGAERTEREE